MALDNDESFRHLLLEAYIGDGCSRRLADALQLRVHELQAQGASLETDSLLATLHRRLYAAAFAYQHGKPLRECDFGEQMN